MKRLSWRRSFAKTVLAPHLRMCLLPARHQHVLAASVCWKAPLSKVNRWSRVLRWILSYYFFYKQYHHTQWRKKHSWRLSVIQNISSVRHFAVEIDVKTAAVNVTRLGFINCIYRRNLLKNTIFKYPCPLRAVSFLSYAFTWL